MRSAPALPSIKLAQTSKQIIKGIILHLGAAWVQPVVQDQPWIQPIRVAPLFRLRRRRERPSLGARYSCGTAPVYPIPMPISSSFAIRTRVQGGTAKDAREENTMLHDLIPSVRPRPLKREPPGLTLPTVRAIRPPPASAAAASHRYGRPRGCTSISMS